MDQKIYLFVDYRSCFYSSVRSRGASMQLDLLQQFFAEYGCELVIKKFTDIDFRKVTYRGQYVLYQSSEDRDLHYKSYIEDIMLALQYQGAILIPDYYELRAHHNKVFMELLRDLSSCHEIKNIFSRAYGTYEDFAAELSSHGHDIVLKPASGALSAGVELASTDSEKRAYANAISRSFHLLDWLKNFVNTYIRKDYVQKSCHRRKFIVQNFIPGLKGDYKILVYHDKYYVLSRETRKNDFRASGSGIFSYPNELPNGLLDYTKLVFDSFNVPFISLDVACLQEKFALIEFQMLSFGTYTLEKSEFFFCQNESGWQLTYEKPVLEREVARSVAKHISRMKTATSRSCSII